MGDIPILLLILLGFAILLRLDFVFYLVYVLAGVYVLMRWSTARALPRLRIRRRFTDHAFLGEAVPVELEVENTSWLPLPWLRVDETAPIGLLIADPPKRVVSMRPKERVKLLYELFGRQRGYYEIGPATLATGDLFGFAEAQGQTELRDHLTVYPRVIPLAHTDLSSRAPLGTVRSRQQIYADPARVTGVREYQRGDPLRSIDWKSSARAQQLQVKKLEPAVSLTTVIFLDLNAAAYNRQMLYHYTEWGIVVAASLANYLVGERQSVGLACNGIDSLTRIPRWNVPARPGRTHLMKVLELLARVETAEVTALPDWLPTAAVDLPWGTTVVAITPSGDEITCRTLHRLLRAGLNPVLVIIEPHGRFGIVQERARRLGFPAVMVSNERELARWRQRGSPVRAA